jgi:hypothetical protein
MRNLFLALLLANLAFAAWHHWFAESEVAPRLVRTDLPDITLVSELDPELAAQAPRTFPETAPRQIQPPGEPSVSPESADFPVLTPTAASPVPASPQERCVSVGPFRELAQAATAASSLRAAGHAPSQRVAEGEVWVGYWVYIDEIRTVAAANEILARVREGGVSDSYVIPGTETGSIVSLGVFSEISRAGRRREELRALDLDPIVADRTQRATVYWVDVTLAPGEVLDFDALQAPGRIVRLEQRACPAAGV